jgi:soluble lytic murein transglycosylase-like protein
MKRPVRVGVVDLSIPIQTASGPGNLRFERENLNGSNAYKQGVRDRNQRSLELGLDFIRQKLGSGALDRIGRWASQDYVSQEALQQRQKEDVARNWYATSDAKDYFRRNPEMLATALKNPVNFYGALVENNRRVQESVKAPKAAPAAQEVAPTISSTGVRSAALQGPAATTKGAREFDAQGRGYEALIQQASAAYGVDATILKRLIASESHFDPNIINKKSGAIGLAQVMPDHIQNGLITEAQARDPATAINFAAAHLAQNLRNEGGDYRNALLRYKGALTQKGVDAMSPVVRNIVSGLQYDAKAVLAAVGPQLARSPDPATNAALALQRGGGAAGGDTGVQQAGVSTGAAPKEKRLNLTNLNTYLTRSDKLPQSVTYVNAQRQLAYAKAQAAIRTGNIAGYEAAVTQLKEYEGDLTRLMGAQAIVDIQNFNDPSRASKLISYLSGGQLELRMRADGNLAYFGRNAQGQPVVLPGRENVSRSDVIETLRTASDEVYRKNRTDAATAAALAAQELAGKIDLEIAKGRIQGEIEQFKGGIDLNKAVIMARAQLEAARLRGQNTASVAVGDENWVTYNDSVSGEQILARPTEVTLPSGQTTVTLDAKPLSQWGGGAQ